MLKAAFRLVLKCMSSVFLNKLHVSLSAGFPSVGPSNHLQNQADLQTGSLRRYPDFFLAAYIYAAVMTHRIKKKKKSLLHLHSIVPPSTLSCWKQQKLQSEETKKENSFLLYICKLCTKHHKNMPVLTRRRKRGEKGEVVETVEDLIVRRLTGERIEELKKLIKETQETHRLSFQLCLNISRLKVKRLMCCCFNRKLKREAELIQAGHLDSKLEELWEDIQL